MLRDRKDQQRKLKQQPSERSTQFVQQRELRNVYVFAERRGLCLATISFPCGRQLEVPVDGSSLEYLSSMFAQRQLEFPGTGRLLIIVTPDFHGGCDGRGWTRQGTSAAARDGQNSGRFGKDGGNERENGTQVSR